MEAALAGVIADAHFFCCAGERCVGVVADGAIAHGGEHDRYLQRDLGRQLTLQLSGSIPLNATGLLSEKDTGFHGFTQRINGGIRHL